ncbi:daptide-type RiPP [Streptomyces rimosus]|uniref:daptide-type RiPP n=1 Tax=Streptomyces rimosus TaxID=1927 RepID=UPI000A3DE4DD|nr:daptide-type RiPP [Streptomyces rimosus]
MQENANHELELGMQELEVMEAPGFWSTAAGVGTGITVVSAVGYSAAWGISVSVAT